MEKHFPSPYQSSILPNKNYLSSFGSMIAFSPKQRTKDLITSQRSIQDRSFNDKAFTFKKELKRAETLIPSSDRPSFKSV